MDLLTYMGLTNHCANDGSVMLRRDDDNPELVPSGDTLRDYIRQFDEVKQGEVTDLFGNLSTLLYSVARERGLLDGIVDVAIDEHNWRHYSDLDTPRTRQVKYDDGTNRAYQFITLSVIGDDGERFVVGFDHVASKQEKLEAMKRLLKTAEKRITIHNIYLDRGFAEVLFVQTLKETGHWVIIRGRINSKTNSMWEDAGGVCVEKNVTMSRSRPPYESVTVTRFVTPAREDVEYEYM